MVTVPFSCNGRANRSRFWHTHLDLPRIQSHNGPERPFWAISLNLSPTRYRSGGLLPPGKLYRLLNTSGLTTIVVRRTQITSTLYPRIYSDVWVHYCTPDKRR